MLVVQILPWTRCFCNVHLFRIPHSWTGSFQMKSSMTFIRGNRYIEKDNFKSCKVTRLKECALALSFFWHFLDIIFQLLSLAKDQ